VLCIGVRVRVAGHTVVEGGGWRESQGEEREDATCRTKIKMHEWESNLVHLPDLKNICENKIWSIHHMSLNLFSKLCYMGTFCGHPESESTKERGCIFPPGLHCAVHTFPSITPMSPTP
jgi:hypothetical protein